MAHDQIGNAAKDKTMELAEESRESEWKFPSFTAEIFQGKFRWDLLHPYPLQSDEDRKIGDEFIAKLKDICEEHIDAEEIDQTGEYPQAALGSDEHLQRPPDDLAARAEPPVALLDLVKMKVEFPFHVPGLRVVG